MKYFQSILKYGAFLGFTPTQKTFSPEILAMFSLFVVNSVMVCLFIARETISFAEYLIVIYVASAAILVTTFYAIAAIKVTNIFTLLQGMENIIESSEYINIFK